MIEYLNKNFTAIFMALVIFLVCRVLNSVGQIAAINLSASVPVAIFTGALFCGAAAGLIAAYSYGSRGVFAAPVLSSCALLYSWFAKGGIVRTQSFVYEKGRLIQSTSQPVSSLEYSLLFMAVIVAVAVSAATFMLFHRLKNNIRKNT